MRKKQVPLDFLFALFITVLCSVFGMILINGKIFVSSNYDKNSPHKFAVTLADHTPNTMMINSLQRFNFWKHFLQNFKLGNVYFENQNIKHYCMECIQLCSIK